jgi:CheY-like chemotaxis protein/two-component sensor histidine kinase
MERQVRHLTRMVDDLLDVTRITRGKIQLNRERIDLARLARTTAEDRRPALETAGLRLIVETPQQPVWVHGDPTRLAQVVNNLLDNAMKFTEKGGQVTVAVTAEPEQARTSLTVRDTGIGIEPAVLPRLFEVFAQADRSLDRTRGGLGLGLAVVRGLVELHGGMVEAHSAGPGKGAAFTVHLPLEPEPPALTEKSMVAPTSVENHRILIIEDNRDTADSLQRLLELIGHEVRVAYTGTDGVALALDWRPEVILCDIGLPGMNGYEVARALRRDPALSKARMLAITGYGQEEDRRLSHDAGFDFHLTKPVDPEMLLEILNHQETVES